MTWAWTLPVAAPPRLVQPCQPLMTEHTRAVVPTFRDWDAARETVDGLLACWPRPAEVVVVDDNVEPNAPAWTRQRGVTLVQYPGNRGPAFARNAGAVHPSHRPIYWLYFTDAGCGRAPDFFAALAADMRERADRIVAVAGPVLGMYQRPDESPINCYMTVEGILNPPMDEHGPQAIVTANALVDAGVFRALGGFDISYPFAAGEDLDLGIKLRGMGPIAWAPNAIVQHRFAEETEDLIRRFTRYGKGTAHLEQRMLLPSLRPVVFTAHLASMQRFADIQIAAMVAGYDQHRIALKAHEYDRLGAR
jgi:GT2 family glycosyltransferase